MPTDHRAELAKIKTFPQLVRYLRDEMGWPIETGSFDDLTFDYNPEELGIDAKNAAKIQEIKRLRPLTPRQPWGIFFVKFEPKRLPVVALRRILSQVALKKRASANSAERAAWAADDLLFVSNYGEGDERQISFAHFSSAQDGHDLPTLRVLGWDNLDTALHLDAVARELTEHLAWPDDDADIKAWRERWRAAFTLRHREVVTTSRELSIRLAELARAIRDRTKTALAIETSRGSLTKLMKAFREALVHDLDADGFADMYAQTIAYGLLSARIADPERKTADDFAGHLRTNPFLRELMETFLKAGGRRGKAGGPGIDFDELGVSEVVELLDDANMEAVVRDFGDRNPQEDPVIHFYELFLKEYDAKKRMQRGVFYTPRPVVSYIVRTVDELLRTEFGLADGLADTTNWGEMVRRNPALTLPTVSIVDEKTGTQRERPIDPETPFVQVLDPATGTGTFLVEAIGIIYCTMRGKWKAQGCAAEKVDALWNEYVPKYLLPRLHGYELLMAPYAIAHLKIGLKLHETGYRFGSEERVRIYLTNALEPASPLSNTRAAGLFEALGHEAEAVNAIKTGQRFAVVMGNPPYAQYSMNLDDHAKAHVEKFRYANGARIRARNALQLERNLNDDYVKFLGFAAGQVPVGGGVLGMITNRMFLDSASLVGLREWFATNYERTLVVDLHGSSEESRRVERLALDENVFDILQGVAVSFHVQRRPSAGTPHPCLSREVIADRQSKYTLLSEDLRLADGDWKRTTPQAPDWWLDRESAPIDSSVRLFKLDDVFPQFSTLVASNRDHLVVDFDREKVIANAQAVRSFKGSNEALCRNFSITLKPGWNVTEARERLKRLHDLVQHARRIEYRPFDRRWIFFHPSLVWQTAPVCSQNVLDKPNRVLISLGKNRAETTNGQWITSVLSDKSVVTTRDNASGFPLYLYEDASELALSGKGGLGRSPNIGRRFVAELSDALGIKPAGDHGLPDGVSPEDILHFVYALLQSPSYRRYYSKDLVSGFPPVPVPPSAALFRELARFGAQLVALHLMESPKLDRSVTVYTGPRGPEVRRVAWSDDTVWLDAAQTKEGQPLPRGTVGFRGVHEAVWNFHIGGYRVCEKWLKDRKDRRLSDDDIAHYQKIVVALAETIRLMGEIDDFIEAQGGWPGAFAVRGGKEREIPAA